MLKKTNFIDFLNNEFSDKKTKKTILKSVELQSVKKIGTDSRKQETVIIEKDFNNKSRNNVKCRLAKASKLIKTIEIFLDEDVEGTKTINDQIIKEWESVYDNTKVDIAKDVENLLKMQKKDMKNKTLSSVLNKRVEYLSGSYFNYTIVVVFLVALSFFLTTVFPNFSNKVIAITDSIFAERTVETIQTNNSSIVNSNAKKEDNSISVTREQLSEYIKKNSSNLKNDINIEVEDIAGIVGGVDE